MEIDWNYIQANWDWAGHILEGLIMAGVVMLLARLLMPWRMAAVAGLAFAIGHFHGREKRDYEVSVDMPPPQLEGFFMWRWSFDQATDFWPAALVLLAVLILVLRGTRKGSG
ncbi:MAG: hypothetical protein QHC90_06690 [Shinella sp.]|nr:hypothetical protein [Shinella sp.]